MNTKVGRPACARRPFIFKATVRRLDWMVMALICLCLARYLGEEPTKKGEGFIFCMGNILVKQFRQMYIRDDVILKILKFAVMLKFVPL